MAAVTGPTFGTIPFQPEPVPATDQPMAPAPPEAPAMPSFTRPSMPAQEKPGAGELLSIIPAILGGIRDPRVLGAALAGLQKGKDRKRALAENEFERQERQSRERADFYSKVLAQANQFDDEIELQEYLAGVQPLAEYYGVPLQGIQVADAKKAAKTLTLVKEALALAYKKNPKEIESNPNYTLTLPGGRTIRLATALEMVGGGVLDEQGKPVQASTPFRSDNPTELKLNAYAKARGKRVDQLTPEEIDEAVGGATESSTQEKDVLINGRLAKAFFDPKKRKYFDVQGNDVTAQVTPVPPREPGTGASDARTDARIDRISAAFNSHPIVKEYNEVQAQHGIIQRVVSGPWSGPGDMAAVFAFMKALDPNSVVRETEYDNAAQSGNIFAGWAARFNGKLNPNGGFLSDQVRKDFLRTISARLDIKGEQYQNLRRQLVKRVERIRAGAPETGDEALIDYSTAIPAAPAKPRKVYDINGKPVQP